MINKILEKISSSWIFFIAVLIIYLFVFIFYPDAAEKSMLVFWNLVINIVPVLVLVFLFVFLTNLFLDAKKIAKYLGEKSGLLGWFIAIFGGIISQGPIYMWYPLLEDLKTKGMRNSLIAAFLYNRSIKIPLIPMIVYFFGWTFFIVLTIYMIIFSVINGWLLEKIVKNNIKT